MKPTDADFETANDVIDFMVDYMQEKEPHAVNAIAAFKEVRDNMPESADDLED